MTEESAKTKKITKQKNTGMAIIAYILFFVPLLTDSKDDLFVKYHVKQGLVLFIASAAMMAVGIIPIIGWIIAMLSPLFILVLMVIGIINAANGEEKPLPIIGQYSDKFKL